MKKPLSSVAAIVGVNGSIRVVVTEPWRMRFHVGKGEKCYIVPGLFVQEPVAHDLIPSVVGRAIALAQARAAK